MDERYITYLIGVTGVLLFISLVLNYRDFENIKSKMAHESICDETENQLMEMERLRYQGYNTTYKTFIWIVYLLASIAVFVGGVITAINKQWGHMIVFVILLAFTSTLTVLSKLSVTAINAADYTNIKTKLDDLYTARCESDSPYYSSKSFDSLDDDLKRSIITKYKTYKEANNKNTFYLYQDIEAEVKQHFVTIPDNNFSIELLKYMNFPYDAKLLNKNVNKICTASPKPSIPLEPVDNNDYSKMINKTEMILNWIVLVIIVYLIVFKNINTKVLVAFICASILAIILIYIMVVRNNIV